MESCTDCSSDEFVPKTDTSEETSSDESVVKNRGSKFFACTYDGCDEVFLKNRKLINHMRRHTGERPFKCDEEGCNKTYTNSSHLRRHKKTFHQEKIKIKCIEAGCNKELSDEYSLKRHYKRVHDVNRKYPFTCFECKQGFHRKRQLLQHSYLHSGQYAFECDVCQTRFPTSYEMKRHKRTHTIYKCECGVEFERWTSLLAHRKTCIKKIIKCETCKKTFSTQSNLNVHKKTHASLEEKVIYKCEVEGCERIYMYQKNLLQHIRSVHENMKKKKIPCPIEGCTVTLSKMQNLKKHLEVHKRGVQQKVLRKPRKDLGEYKSSTAAALSGIILPPRMEKCLLEGNLDVDKLQCEAC